MRRNTAKTVRSRSAAVLFSAAALFVVTGCSDGRLATYPVTGTVVVDGQPAGGALLIFCPVEGQQPAELLKLRPAGETGPDGRYQMTTYETHDGAPAGQYRVMVRWAAPTAEASDEGRRERGRRPPDRLRGRYMNPQTSGLTATVQEDDTEVPPFELRTK